MAPHRAHAHHSPRTWIAIALAGAVGSLLRYAVTSGGGWGTIVVANFLGCAILGALVGRSQASPALSIGLCGGLTTFSGMAVQASASARDAGPGIWHAVESSLAVQHLGGAFVVLAVNGVVGLVAFLVGRRLGDASTPGAIHDGRDEEFGT